MRLLNLLSKCFGHVEIENGNVEKVFFNMQADNVSASGTVLFMYKDLKVKLLKAEEDGAPMNLKNLCLSSQISL
jgi:hypothetical protein